MKEKTEEENKEKAEVNEVKNDGLLMKPFALGWKREVVKRSMLKVGTPDYDIYYCSPKGKKIRSLIEMKHYLTDGLNPECFSFKRKPLGFSSEYETVRNARVLKKGYKQGNPIERQKKIIQVDNVNASNETKKEDIVDEKKNEKMETNKQIETTVEEQKGNSREVEEKAELKEEVEEKAELKEKVEEKAELKEESEKSKEEKLNGKIETEEKEEGDKTNQRSKRVIKVKKFDESGFFSNRLKEKSNEEAIKNNARLRPQSLRRSRKEVLKTVMKVKQAKQTKVGAGNKIVKRIVKKRSTLQKTPKTKKETALKTQKSKNLSKSTKKLSRNTKNEGTKDGFGKSESDDKTLASDLKSIVKKNIGKYREMREKQKLGKIKTLVRHERKTLTENSRKSRSEPISLNKTFLKPLQNGWRRELVFRRCSKQQADVYYFHPSGKKLRSRREISEYLTHGLSIDCFTFKKEVLGVGEPAETVRNARPKQ